MRSSMLKGLFSLAAVGAFAASPVTAQVYTDWVGNKISTNQFGAVYTGQAAAEFFWNSYELKMWGDGGDNIPGSGLPSPYYFRNWSPSNYDWSTPGRDYPGMVQPNGTGGIIIPTSAQLDNIRFTAANHTKLMFPTSTVIGDILTVHPRVQYNMDQEVDLDPDPTKQRYEFHIGKILQDTGFTATTGYQLDGAGNTNVRVFLEGVEVRSGIHTWRHIFSSRARHPGVTDNVPFTGTITGGVFQVFNQVGMTEFTGDDNVDKRALQSFAPTDSFNISGTGMMVLGHGGGAGHNNAAYNIQPGGTLKLQGGGTNYFQGQLPGAPGVPYHNKVNLNGGRLWFNTTGGAQGGDLNVTASSVIESSRNAGGSLGMITQINKLTIGGASPMTLTMNATSTNYESHGLRMNGLTHVKGNSSIVAGINNAIQPGPTVEDPNPPPADRPAPMVAYFLGGMKFDAPGGTTAQLSYDLEAPVTGAHQVRVAGDLDVNLGNATPDGSGVASVDLITGLNQNVAEYFLSTTDNTDPENPIVTWIYTGVTSVTSNHNLFGSPITGTRYTSYNDLEQNGDQGDYVLSFINDSETNTHIMRLMVLVETALPPLAGDFDGSDTVGAGDLNLVLGNWGQSSVPPQWVNWIPAGIVGAAELNAVLGNWGASQVLAEMDRIMAATGLSEAQVLAMIPEPASLALLSLGGLMVLRRRRAA